MPTNREFRDAVKRCAYPPGQPRFTPVIKPGETEPVFSSGGRAMVFKVTEDATGKLKGLKLFLLEDTTLMARYERISPFLAGLHSAYFVTIAFVPNLIWVSPENPAEQGAFHPALVMDWAGTTTLDTRLGELCAAKDGPAIAEIARKFKDLCLFLLKSKFAHGDLKPENIMIDDNNQLVLVDYDGCFIQDFAGERSPENGTDTFQHPARRFDDFHADLDHFSMLSIYTSLLALSVDTSLYRLNDQQNLIFTPGDYAYPKQSPLFRILAQLPATKRLAYFIKHSLESNSIVIPFIADLLNGNFPRPVLHFTQSPESAFVGDKMKLNWVSEYCSFVSLNGNDMLLTGSLELIAEKGNPVLFRGGNDGETLDFPYSVQAAYRPKIVLFKVDDDAVRAGEYVTLRWHLEFTEKAILRYEDQEQQIDLTAEPYTRIGPLETDTAFSFEVIGEGGLGLDNAILKVAVCYPVELTYTLERKTTFPNKPVRLQLHTRHAKKIMLYPCGHDLTDLGEYELLVGKLTNYTIIAENDKFSATEDFTIDTLPLPVYQQVVTLPRLQIVIRTPLIVLPAPPWIKLSRPRPFHNWKKGIVRLYFTIQKMFSKHA
jgi:serine/threonine protein kinase